MLESVPPMEGLATNANIAESMLFALAIMMCPGQVSGQEFVHPGGMFKQFDLDRMAALVLSGRGPYATSFAQLQSHPLESL